MKLPRLITFVTAALAFSFGSAEAQQPKKEVPRVGVLVPGEAWYEIVDGLRAGLKQFGLEDGHQIMLAVRDWKGDTKLAEAAVKTFQQEKVSLIYASSTNSAIVANRARAEIPILFCAGTDPVAVGLVQSFAKPGGRLTGVYNSHTDLTAKRLEILKDIVPKLRRVLTFYNPQLRTGIESSKLAREAAQQHAVQLVEGHFTTDDELLASVRALKTGDGDAYLALSDPTLSNQAKVIIETARMKKLPTMFDLLSHVSKGGLAGYAVNFNEMGRRSAKYVPRLLAGVKPQELPVEGIDKIELVINLKTAKQIGLTIPPNVLARANRVIR